MNKREKTIEKIFNTLITQGKVTSKPNPLGEDPMEDKVYTRRLHVNKTLGEGANAIELVYITITSDDVDFSDVMPTDMRLNTKNTRGEWCNLFIDEATNKMLDLVENSVCQ